MCIVLSIPVCSIRIGAAPTSPEKLPEEEIKKDVVAVQANGFMVIPHLYYKPETQVAGGLVFITYFRPSTQLPLNIRPSTIATTFTYTQNKQFIWQLFPEFYMDNEKLHIVGAMEYLNYPNLFYGIGNDTPAANKEHYTSDIFRSRVELQRDVWNRLYLGIVYQYEWSHVTKAEEGGMIAKRDVPGSRGGNYSSGAGFSVTYDTRDNNLYTTKGEHYQFTAIAFNKFFGSGYDFLKYTLDIRKYFPTYKNQALALQGYANVISGTAPFEMLSQLGGKQLMRGLFMGRYRDNDMVLLQSEYRMHLFWRFGAVVFASVGDVMHRLEYLDVKDFKVAYGSGIRFCINTAEKINARIDYGRCGDFNAFYITIGEAI